MKVMKSVFSSMSINEHEQVCFFYDAKTQCKVIIAIHNTKLGPALGGCRFLDYPNEESALHDVLRLSRGMSYKSAAADLPLGGGKSVIIGDHKKLRSKEFFDAYAGFVQSLNGRYICSVDMNTSVDDLIMIKDKCSFVAGLSESQGGIGSPTPYTAFGVYEGLKVALKHKLSLDSFDKVKVAISGVGNVGKRVCEYLYNDNAQLYVADIDAAKTEYAKNNFNAKVVDSQSIHSLDVDVYVPCATGGVLNDKTIPEIKAKIVAGAANNQLLDENKHSKMLYNRDILYCPDFIINSGGLICAYYGFTNSAKDQAMSHTSKIPSILKSILDQASQNNVDPVDAATELGKQKILAGSLK